jgi:CelD/BcsL family acetyltransferase involved in cellulose biosynthesis
MSSLPTHVPVARTPAPPLRTSGGLTLDVRDDLSLATSDAAAFDRLIDNVPHVAVFMSRAWLSGYFVEPPPGCSPALILFRENGELRGIVPIAVRRTKTHSRVSLLGGGAGSDRVELIAAPGYEPACSDAFLNWLETSYGANGFVLEMRDVPGDSPLWGAVHRAGLERHLRLALEPQETHTLPYLDFTARRRVPELTTTAGSLLKHRRWLERRGKLRVEVLKDHDEALEGFESLVRLLHDRWETDPAGSVLDKPHVQRFHRHVIPLLLREGRLRMIRFSADLRTIAVFYGLTSGKWWGYYLAGYDRKWAGRIHLGWLTLAAAVDIAAQQGADEFDFLKGVDQIKYRWPVRERITLDANVYSRRSGPQLARAGYAARSAAIALGRAAHNLFSSNGIRKA